MKTGFYRLFAYCGFGCHLVILQHISKRQGPEDEGAVRLKAQLLLRRDDWFTAKKSSTTEAR
jgi:uncharacterized protein YutD